MTFVLQSSPATRVEIPFPMYLNLLFSYSTLKLLTETTIYWAPAKAIKRINIDKKRYFPGFILILPNLFVIGVTYKKDASDTIVLQAI